MSVRSPYSTQKERGGYSAIVYKDGDLYVTEDNLGTIILESAIASTVIQAALDFNVGRVLCINARYPIATGISIPSHRSLEGESYETIFEQPSTPISELIKNDYSAGATNFQIRNLTLDGQSRGVDWKHGMWFQNISWFNIENIRGINFTGGAPTNSRNSLLVIGSEDTASRLGMYGTIHNILADNVRGDVVYLTGRENQAAFSEHINVDNIVGKNCTGNIVDFNEVQYSNISNVIGYNPGESCILTDGIHYCTISNITSYTPKKGIVIGHHAAGKTGYSSYNTLSNIICYHPTEIGIHVLNSRNNTITGFQLLGSSESDSLLKIEAIGVGTTDEGDASHNKFVNGIITTPNQHAVYINEATTSDDASYTDCENVRVVKTSGGSVYGFVISGDHSTLTGCTARGASFTDGFYFLNVSHATLLGSTAIACAGYGVKGFNADYLLLIANHLTGNTSGSTSGLGPNSKVPTDSNFL